MFYHSTVYNNSTYVPPNNIPAGAVLGLLCRVWNHPMPHSPCQRHLPCQVYQWIVTNITGNMMNVFIFSDVGTRFQMSNKEVETGISLLFLPMEYGAIIWHQVSACIQTKVAVTKWDDFARLLGTFYFRVTYFPSELATPQNTMVNTIYSTLISQQPRFYFILLFADSCW